MRLYALLRLGFPTPPLSVKLATKCKSLTHYTKGTPSRNKSALTACTHTVSGSISLPSPGFFSPFPHGTSSLSVSKEYLALEDGPPIFSQSFTCSDLLNTSSCNFVYGAITLYRPTFQTVPLSYEARLIPVRSPLLGESRLISFPRGT